MLDLLMLLDQTRNYLYIPLEIELLQDEMRFQFKEERNGPPNDDQELSEAKHNSHHLLSTL